MSCICSEFDHSTFDKIIDKETKLKAYCEDILNDSLCVSINLAQIEEFRDISLDVNEILFGLGGKIGVYHLWIEVETCVDHYNHKMLCAYVGKGYSQSRIKSHIKDKWVKDETLYVSFYECENRIAKYIEQLFLDSYDFYLNKEENRGTEYLHTIWPEERVLHGTELHEQAELLAKKHPEAFNPILD